MRSLNSEGITHFRNHSVIIDKKDTVSTHCTQQTFKSLDKSRNNISLISRRRHSCPFKQQQNKPSPPIEIYFNPEIRKNYLKKVIDNFFVPAFNSQTDFVKQKKSIIKDTHKYLYSNNKKKIISISNFSQMVIDNYQYKNNLKQSYVSDISKGNSLAIIGENTSNISIQQNNVNQQINSFQQKRFHLTSKNSRHIRPLTQKKTKRSLKVSQQDQNLMRLSWFLNQTHNQIQTNYKQSKRLMFQNQYFAEYQVYQGKRVVSVQRNYFGQDNVLLKREEKIAKRGIKTLAKHTFSNTIEYPACKAFNTQISHQFSYGQTEQDSFIQIYEKDFYNKLFSNKNQQIMDIITCMVNFILQNKGKILTNSIMLDNLYRVDQKIYVLKDLSRSGIVDEIKIRSKYIRSLTPPLLKKQNSNQWFRSPQYLSPQLLNSYLNNNNFDWIKYDHQTVMASEIWSLGCMMVQILTLIPLNENRRCKMKNSLQIFRNGFLSINFHGKFFDYETLIKKQISLFSMLTKNLQKQLVLQPIQPKLIEIIKQMLRYKIDDRLRPSQILEKLRALRK